MHAGIAGATQVVEGFGHGHRFLVIITIRYLVMLFCFMMGGRIPDEVSSR